MVDGETKRKKKTYLHLLPSKGREGKISMNNAGRGRERGRGTRSILDTKTKGKNRT